MNQDLVRRGTVEENEMRHSRGGARLQDISRPLLPVEEPNHHEENSQPNMAAEYYRTVVRHRWLIAGLAFAGILLSILFHLGTQPVYETRTSLEIQAMNSDFLDAHSITPNAVSPSDTIVATQLKLLGSDSLAERVKNQLTDEPHTAVVRENDLLSRVQRTFHLHSGRGIPFNNLLDETANGVKIKAMGISQLVEVTCDSWDPSFAAQYCNTLTSEFQNTDLESRGAQAKRISDWLVHQAADVREKAQESQHRLEAATGGNGLMLSPQNDNIGEDHLRQMQTELVRAQADRMEKQAELAVAQNGNADSGPENATYAAEKIKLADLQAQVAALVPPLTEANPKVIHLRAQIAEVQASMQREKASSAGKLQEAYTAAKHREDLLNMSYKNIEGSVSSDLQKSSEVDLLRREVQSEQQLYQTLLQRAKEAGFASAMPASTIRIVDPAKPPLFAVYPKRLTAAFIGALLGTVLGILAAFVLERQVPRLRLPGDVTRFIRIEELGVIPSASAQGKGASKLVAPVQGALVKWNGGKGHNAALATAKTWSEEALVAESYRNTTLSLLLSEPERGSRTFIISSPNAGEGKTTVTSNLGIALSKSKLRVVLVDGDMRKPNLHRMLDVENTVGLRNVLRDGVAAYAHKMEEICQPTAFANLSVIPSGTGNEPVADLLYSPQLRALLDDLEKRFDVVLVDTPPMLHIADARIFAGQTNRAILVFRSGVTKRSNAVTVRNMLQRDRVRITGSILNDFHPRREGQGKYYSGYYDYYDANAMDRAKAS